MESEVALGLSYPLRVKSRLHAGSLASSPKLRLPPPKSQGLLGTTEISWSDFQGRQESCFDLFISGPSIRPIIDFQSKTLKHLHQPLFQANASGSWEKLRPR